MQQNQNHQQQNMQYPHDQYQMNLNTIPQQLHQQQQGFNNHNQQPTSQYFYPQQCQSQRRESQHQQLYQQPYQDHQAPRVQKPILLNQHDFQQPPQQFHHHHERNNHNNLLYTKQLKTIIKDKEAYSQKSFLF